MTASRSKDNPEKKSTTPAEDAPEDALLTSEDLFGDLVDSPIPQEKPVVRPAAADRKEPIRVQITEPGALKTSRPPSKSGAGPSEMREVPDEEVAHLLDVFDAPPSPRSDPKTDVFKAPTAEDLAKARAAAPPPRPVPPPSLNKTQPMIAPTAASPTRKPAAAAPTPAPDRLEDEVPPPASRTATKFAAAAPARPRANEPPGLDLAAVAEDALGGGSAVPSAGAMDRARRAAEMVYGPYRLMERIAVGGMAEVFRAKRSGVEGFEKIVAVKRILPHLSDNKEFVNMFIDEAKMVAGLTHPHIVQMFDLGKIEKTYFIAMEYVHGRDLRSIMKRAQERGIRIPLDLGVLIVGKVCAALEYAHRKKDDRGRALKIVHRDVSPQNILISYEGDVKLTDFGIAKAAARATTTDRGALRGKLLYMSPEQANGRSMDCRSDVFSLGIVFYEMITDQRPFMATSEKSILEMVRECQIQAPVAINPRIPPRLDKIVLKALSRDPDDRYQDAAEMGRDLERFLHERNTPNPTAIELARFMEVLFDEKERGTLVTDEPTGSGEHRSGNDLEMEFEADADEHGDAPSGPVEPMSVQKLLKRFGLK
jgi:serine/threonine protein kinase